MFFNFTLVYAIRSVQVNQGGLKLNDTHQILLYADDVNITGGRVHITKKKRDHLLVSGKETGLEVNADKTKYIVMSRDQNAGRSHNIKIDNSFFERQEQFKYLRNSMYQNSIQEEVKSRLKSENTCYNLVQNLLSYSLIPKNIMFKIDRTMILPVLVRV